MSSWRRPPPFLLNEKSGKRTLVDIKSADGNTRQIVVRPVSAGRQNAMLRTSRSMLSNMNARSACGSSRFEAR